MSGPRQLPPVFKGLADAFSAQQTYLIFSPLTPETADKVYADTRPWKSDGSIERLLLVLDSPGGDISAAYQVINIMRRLSKHVTIAVPRWAKSAATLICLGASELVMTEVAELGPIDPQIRRSNEVQMRPALDEYSSLEAMRTDTMKTVDRVMRVLVPGASMNVDELLPTALRFVAELMQPVYAQISPQVHASHKRTLRISEEYALRILSRWGSVSNREQIKELAYALCFGYPSHDFVIDHRELNERKFPVRLPRPEEDIVLSSLVNFSQRLEYVGWLVPPDEQTEEARLAQQEAAVADQESNQEGSAGSNATDSDDLANLGGDSASTDPQG